MPAVIIEHVTTPTDDARALVGELDALLHADSPPENRHGFSIERIFQPGMLFFIARLDDGTAAGCGGVGFHEPGLAEVKRMFVRPAARGNGVAQAILSRLEQEARARGGVDRVVLETGDNRDAAMRLYERAGFTRCGPFAPYTTMPPIAIAHSVFYEKPLA